MVVKVCCDLIALVASAGEIEIDDGWGTGADISTGSGSVAGFGAGIGTGIGFSKDVGVRASAGMAVGAGAGVDSGSGRGAAGEEQPVSNIEVISRILTRIRINLLDPLLNTISSILLRLNE